MDEENTKITKQLYAFKGYAIFCYVEILNPFNLELQRKDTEPAIKHKLIDLLNELKGFEPIYTIIISNIKKISKKEFLLDY